MPLTRRILLTTDTVGGVWRYGLDLARGLSAAGVETTLLGFGPRPDAAQRAEAESVADLAWADLPLDWACDCPEELAGVPRAIGRHASAASADLVQVNVPSQAAGLDLEIPVVAMVHSCVTSWFRTVRGSSPPGGWNWQQPLTRAGLDRADAVVAPSHAFARLLAECYPGLGRVAVVPNATTVVPSQAHKQPFAYAAARWWDEGKNATVLDAAAKFCRAPIFAAGATTGPGGAHVHFRHARDLGRLDQQRLWELAGRAAVFVSPSLYEPFGLAALEAARAGAALVLADIPTYRELWDGAAQFADPRDPRAFAAGIDRLIEDDNLRHSTVAESAARAATFTTEAQAALMLGLYRALAPQRETMGAA